MKKCKRKSKGPPHLGPGAVPHSGLQEMVGGSLERSCLSQLATSGIRRAEADNQRI